MITPLQNYCDRWSLNNGCGNDICSRRKSLVLGKGSVPCDVLFLGEAPGESEDAIGQPFVGPAGQTLDRWIKNATATIEGTIRIAFTNLLACIPREATGRKAVEPLPHEVKQCSQRLREFVLLCDGHNPNSLDPTAPYDALLDYIMGQGENLEEGTLKLIVTVGSHARDYLDQKMMGSVRFHRPIPRVHILHPAYVLRQNDALRQILAQRQTVILKSALEDL